MSTQRGNASRTRAQKYKNHTVFKNDLHDKRPEQKRLNALHVSEVCQHCKSVIEWKIKYKKYKALTQAKTCTRCQQRNILKAYHVLCRDCARETRVCAKCMKSAEEVEIEPAQPTPVEALKLKVEMERLVKSFPERKRRAFLRYMDKGKKEALTEEAEQEQETADADDQLGDDKDAVKQKAPRVPHSREELLKKIEQLKLVGNGDEDDLDSDDDSEDYSDNSDEEDDEDD